MYEKLAIILILIVVLIAIYIYVKRYGFANFTMRDIFKYNIYLDNNGTTEMCSEALEMYSRASKLGNASSSYANGARELIAQSDNLIKKWANAPNYKVIYTNGGTESNVTILHSLSDYYQSINMLPHFILSSYEHNSFLECARQLEKQNKIQLSLISPNIYGEINPQLVIQAIRYNTVLVSVMHINNETGNINNIREICAVVKRQNPTIYFHSDVVQSFGKFSIPTEAWLIDALSVSYHKFYGPIGVGALIVHPTIFNKIKSFPLINGSQNNGARGGTTNIAGIGAGYAALQKAITNRQFKNEKLFQMKKYLVEKLSQKYPIGNYADYAGQDDSFHIDYPMLLMPNKNEVNNQIVFLGNHPLSDSMSPNTLLLSIVKYGPLKNHFCNIQLKKDLQDRGVIISIGSACHSENPEPSHVLYSLRAPFIIRCGVIRISLGDYNTISDVESFYKKLIECINLQN